MAIEIEKDDFLAIIKRQWNRNSHSSLKDIVDSLPLRISAVSTARGGTTRYKE
jgi:hypothetical protein